MPVRVLTIQARNMTVTTMIIVHPGVTCSGPFVSLRMTRQNDERERMHSIVIGDGLLFEREDL